MAKTGGSAAIQDLWYKDAIIYELHIKAFADGNNDGIGDFQGLLEKLDYLQELGVTAIWVLPFYPSPLRDDGYDIADYYSINPSYGRLEEFQQFLEEAHKRQLKVITELVINHTSDQHPWFQRARKAPKDSPERAYYVWTDDPSKYRDVRIIFQDFESSNWSWDPVAGQYYWHRFFHHQPDLNYDNPLVREEVFKIIDYWCEMGVDGFRLDAVPYLFEREGTNGENLPETHGFLKELRAHVDEKYPGTLLLAEANMWPEDSASYFGEGDECHMNYHFPVMPRMFMALQMEDRYPITDIFDQTPKIPDNCQWAMFLRNHDELTLEMVTDEERDYMYKVYVKDPKARINLGIRHRLAPLMDNDRRRIELMNSLLFSLPGTPVLYYGDEIGMGDNFYLGDRDGVRTPMQWSPDRNAGFSSTNPQRLYLPVILDPEYHYESVNVETQRRNTSSLFWFMKRLINLRKKFRAFSRGDMTFINVDNPKVLAFIRKYEDDVLLIVVNLSKFSQPAALDLSDYRGYQPVELYSKNRFPAVETDKSYFLTLGPHAYQWFSLEKTHPELERDDMLPKLLIKEWNNFLHTDLKEQLENKVLASYLKKCRWFVGRNRSIHTLSISEAATIPLPGYNAFPLLVHVEYGSGLPETYFLPLVFIHGDLASKLEETCPQSIVARIEVSDKAGLLCDALFTPELQRLLIAQFGNSKPLNYRNGYMVAGGTEEIQKFLQEGEEIKAKLHTESDSYTAIAYNNRFFLKIYRKVEKSVHPDFEITRFLDSQNFAFIPGFTGMLEWENPSGRFVVGMMQPMIENHGDGESFMLERINNYIERILARDKSKLIKLPLVGALSRPVSFEELPEDIRILLGGTAPEQVRLFGERMAQLHIALASSVTEQDFTPENFSLHYQRSLYSALQTLVRETLSGVKAGIEKFPEGVNEMAEHLTGRRAELLEAFRRIYKSKLDVVKTRIHGNFGLTHILFTGRDISFKDFSGDPVKSFSERRLKRSPLRDVAAMIRSFYYVAYEGFFATSQLPREDIPSLLPFADSWSHYMCQIFLHSYIKNVAGHQFIPPAEEELNLMIETYLLDRCLHDLGDELRNSPEGARVPLRIIELVMEGKV